MTFLDIAKQAIAARGQDPPGVNDKNDRNDKSVEPLETALKGRAVELWSNSAGSLFLVADEEDAKLTMARYGARRGEVYSGAEVQRIVSIRDPVFVAQIHAWKKRFDSTVLSVIDNSGTRCVSPIDSELNEVDLSRLEENYECQP